MCYSLLLKPWPLEIVDLPNLKMGGFSSSQTVSLPEGKYLDTHEYVDMETTSSASPYITHGDRNIFWTGNFPFKLFRIPGNAPTSRPRHHHPCR